VAGFISSVYLAAVLVAHAGVLFLSGYAALADHFELLGYVIVAFFILVWVGAMTLWRVGGFDRRYADPVGHHGEPLAGKGPAEGRAEAQ
jgi:high-affinity nickel-transport protein